MRKKRTRHFAWIASRFGGLVRQERLIVNHVNTLSKGVARGGSPEAHNALDLIETVKGLINKFRYRQARA